MTSVPADVMEMVLRECAADDEKAWFPSEYARATSIDRSTLDEAVDQLRVLGLIRIADWQQGKGQSYLLTPAGADVLHNPRMLSRLRNGRMTAKEKPERREYREETVASWDRGKAIQDALMGPARPVMSMSLIVLNLIVFGYGWMLAQRQGVSTEYLSMQLQDDVNGAKVIKIRYDTGALSTTVDVQQGRWWRLFTCCFVHHGGFHIALNMLALYMLGPMVERMFGKSRFLIMFVVAGVAGSSLAVLVGRGSLLAGASGSICGMLGCLIPWALLNRSYLPAGMTSNLIQNGVINILLMSFISSLPGISWEGHLGGAIAGAVMTVPLNFSRFGRGSQRLAGCLGVVVLPVLFFGYVGYALKPSEEQQVRSEFRIPMVRFSDRIDRFHPPLKNWARDVLNEEEGTDKQRTTLLNKLGAIVNEGRQISERLKKLRGTFQKPKVNQTVENLISYLDKVELYLQTAKKTLERNVITREIWQPIRSLSDSVDAQWRIVEDSVLFPPS